MGGFWPFKKKPPETEGQKIVTYSADDNSSEELLSDRSHIEDEQYKAALDLLTKPHIEMPDGGDPSVVEVLNSDTSSNLEYVQSDDGYWYLKKEDGTFDPQPYLKNKDGSYSKYSS
ncbi:MAG: hypothetical protein CMA77_03595 [Euryarchaeota archaeon]|nr:hypothetical protein [Euryarchaeota archaeon]|tara:strand:+ start:307 stop:654 length:348 start_codon:yes stop_codon:yes gene_type:complete